MTTGTESNNGSMNRPLKFWEFLLGIAGLFITVSVMIYNRGSMDAASHNEIENLKIQIQDVKNSQELKTREQSDKLDKISDKVTEVLIEMQNKADRKNP